MMKKVKKRVPELRFPEFHEDWQTDRIDRFLVRYVNPVDVQLETNYKQIGIRSHGKGIFHKDPVTGEELGNKRVYWVHQEAFTVNIVFAWEQAVALTSSNEQGFIASHRFLMFLPKENRADLKFVLLFFLRKRGKSLLELASPGGAGRNKTLGQDSFAELKITLPFLEEQEKITNFLGLIDTRLTQLRRKHELLQTYKRGVMQKIFSQELRFKDSTGSDFPNWEAKKLGEIADLSSGGTPSRNNLNYWQGDIPWISASSMYTDIIMDAEQKITQAGLDNGSRIAVKDSILILVRGSILLNRIVIGVAGKNVAFNQDIKALKLKDGKQPKFVFYWLKYKNNFLRSMVSVTGLGAGRLDTEELKNMIISEPTYQEQERIVNFLTAIDKKIETVAQQIDQTERFKKGLLQKMFV